MLCKSLVFPQWRRACKPRLGIAKAHGSGDPCSGPIQNRSGTDSSCAQGRDPAAIHTRSQRRHLSVSRSAKDVCQHPRCARLSGRGLRCQWCTQQSNWWTDTCDPAQRSSILSGHMVQPLGCDIVSLVSSDCKANSVLKLSLKLVMNDCFYFIKFTCL